MLFVRSFVRVCVVCMSVRVWVMLAFIWFAGFLAIQKLRARYASIGAMIVFFFRHFHWKWIHYTVCTSWKKTSHIGLMLCHCISRFYLCRWYVCPYKYLFQFTLHVFIAVDAKADATLFGRLSLCANLSHENAKTQNGSQPMRWLPVFVIHAHQSVVYLHCAYVCVCCVPCPGFTRNKASF